MKKIIKLLFLPLTITPFFLSSCVSQETYENSKKEIKKVHEENQKSGHR